MLTKIILSSAALIALTGVTAAADLPARMAPPVYAPPPLPTFTWTGAYFGVNAGYAFDHQGKFRTQETLAATTVRSQELTSDGFTGGGQVGYNYQFGAGSGIVVGIEADASYTDLDRSRTIAYPFDAPTSLFATTTTYRSGLDYLGTVRGRVGYAFNQFMIYGTGGLAFGSVDNRVTVAGIGAGQSDSTETGLAYGGGVEYALPTGSFLNFFKSSAVTMKAEYIHYDLGRTNVVVRTPGGANFATARVSNDGDLARLGLNYKFGSY